MLALFAQLFCCESIRSTQKGGESRNSQGQGSYCFFSDGQTSKNLLAAWIHFEEEYKSEIWKAFKNWTCDQYPRLYTRKVSVGPVRQVV